MTEQQYFAGVGRRKTSVARVRLVPGTGEIVVNGRPVDTYFGGSIWTAQVFEPFQAANQAGRFNADVRVVGGGLSGQAGAIRHGVARALVAMDEALKPTLRKGGFL